MNAAQAEESTDVIMGNLSVNDIPAKVLFDTGESTDVIMGNLSVNVWINYNELGKNEYHVKNLPEIFYSKSRARLSHAMALHHCKKG